MEDRVPAQRDSQLSGPGVPVQNPSQRPQLHRRAASPRHSEISELTE